MLGLFSSSGVLVTNNAVTFVFKCNEYIDYVPIVGFYKMLSFEYQAQQILNTFLTSLSSSLKEVDINQFPDMM